MVSTKPTSGLDPKRGMETIRQQAKWLAAEQADAAASMLEGLETRSSQSTSSGCRPYRWRRLCTINIIE